VIDEPRARELAAATLTNPKITLGDATELREGWHFSYRPAGLIGSNGIVVNKKTGRTFQLGSGFPRERDRGWQSWRYDLVVLAIRDPRETQVAIERLRLTITEPTYENGQVWRIARPMTELERWSRLEKLPCIFPAVPLYFDFEVLEEVRAAGWFTFDAVEYRERKIVP
jgi:hypothetical protein